MTSRDRFEGGADGEDARLYAPATARNREPLFEALRDILPAEGACLEVASGTGEHAAFLAPQFPGLVWQPSDPDPKHRASIAAWIRETGHPTLRAPIDLRADQEPWPLPDDLWLTAMLNINMIHISPWSACEGLLEGAGQRLPEGAPLVLYGPFKRDGRHTAPSNAAFDENLRSRDPHWGVRDMERVVECAWPHGFRQDRVIPMPANNFVLVLRMEDGAAR
jgi:hypothetical protein